MAEQNRKSNEQKASRKAAEQIVDMFLDVIFASDSDAGWQGTGLLGKLVDFKGELPASSGFSGFSKVWEQSRLFNAWGADHVMACIVMRQLSDRQREAVCVDRCYRGRTKVAVDPFVPEKRVEIYWDDPSCAQHLRCTVSAMQKRISDGYMRIEDIAGQKIKKAA